MECRPAVVDDIPWLTDTFVTALRTAITAERGYRDEQKERDQFAEQLRLADTWVLLTEGSRVAFYTAWPEADHLFLGTMCVTPERQNRGIGTQAMRTIANQAGERPIHLAVLKANTAARRFYERLGCRKLSTSRHHDHFEWPTAAFPA
jgi:ribosomal protein S18 acetylase RimI-like enzyme